MGIEVGCGDAWVRDTWLGMSTTQHVQSADGLSIAYESSGTGATALVFVHGWLGSGRWWDAQRDAFAARFKVVQLDLGGHGASGRERAQHSAQAYANDIVSVVKAIDAQRVVLVGHSMSGAYAVLAAPQLPNAVAMVLVDTLKNVEEQMPKAQLDGMFELYRRDFRAAVEGVLPMWLFAPGTPAEVSARLKREFLERNGAEGVALLEPLYAIDLPTACKAVKGPVRAINTDLQPTDVEANRRHFGDYAARIMPGFGHYPMLEAPHAFNAALEGTLSELGLDR